jgi:hypothetical protein
MPLLKIAPALGIYITKGYFSRLSLGNSSIYLFLHSTNLVRFYR